MKGICTVCHYVNCPDARFCVICGSPLKPKCPNCGGSVEDDQNFCGNCGNELSTKILHRDVSPASYTPAHLIKRILAERHLLVGERKLVTVLFVDIVDSTATAVALNDAAWVDKLKRFYELASKVVANHGGEVVNSTGDGLLAVFDGTARAVRCGTALVDGVATLGLASRVGLHAGEIEVLDDDVAGIAVHIGSRVASAAGPDEVWVSRTVTDLLAGSGISFSSRGEHQLKGLDEPWALYVVDR
jgi:class 3 adenylate cyclase